ncbi:MAG: ExeM/NucH family extracellular endonuclease, partial [Chlorobiales bacterium]|nr:ExeM/NucH family extracellular endonuclease [Chlorobiales bacterium]
LAEIENDGYGPDSALQNLVDGLNAAAQPGTTYALVDPGLPRLGGDEIAVALLFRVETVAPFGPAATTDAYPFDAKNRQPLAQTFSHLATDERLTVVVNHLKSKGSCESATDLNSDQGDGQGCWNALRVDAAVVLADWLATDPTGSGDPDVLIVGDLNAYAMEDPIAALKAAGYTDLIAGYAGADAYSYVYSGQAGYLDHALSNASLTPQVIGVTIWHINADEPRALDYNDHNQPALYQPNLFRSSDHDPVLVGLTLHSAAELALSKTVSPSSVRAGSQLTYTIMLENVGSHAATTGYFTDELPAQVGFAGWVEQPAGATEDDGLVTWNGNVGMTDAVTFTFAVTNNASSGTVTNTAWCRSDDLSWSDEATFTVEPLPPSPLLWLTKTVEPDTDVPLESVVTYSIRLGN